MPAKNEKSEPEVELKVRIPKSLMEQIDEFRFKRRMATKKKAVIALLTRALRPIGKS